MLTSYSDICLILFGRQLHAELKLFMEKMCRMEEEKDDEPFEDPKGKKAGKGGGKNQKHSKPNLRSNNKGTINPSSLFSVLAQKNPRFRGNRQQDAHELLRYLLDTLREETLDATVSQRKKRSQAALKQWTREDIVAWLDSLNLASSGEDMLATFEPVHGTFTGATLVQMMANWKSKNTKAMIQAIAFGSKEDRSNFPRYVSQLATLSSPYLRTWVQKNFAEEQGAQVRSVVDDVFKGVLQSTVECQTCHAVSKVEEPFYDLSLPIEPVEIVKKKGKGKGNGGGSSYDAEWLVDVQPNKRKGKKGKKGKNKNDVSADENPFAPIDENAELKDQPPAPDADSKEAESPDSIIKKKGKLAGEVTVMECLQAFTEPEILDGDDAYGCVSCTKKVLGIVPNDRPAVESGSEIESGLEDEEGDAEAEEKPQQVESVPDQLIRRTAVKRYLIKEPPKILTLHLKRFKQVGNRLDKSSKNVPFPTELDIQSCCHIDEKDEAKPLELFHYKLFGVSVHHGGMNGGHYIAHVLKNSADPNNSSWHYFSDTNFNAEDQDEALRAQGYILFYKRVY
eukprot:TRINITY_DN2532_c0_g1_i1.p1 TRINITY_DN2532_c0_g1~~TRINITY_DN2532_c0_g1_i1.p1  ORF type:complete len:565 (-),score=150.92 TRINITY_DN2532_c0_g1_i1:1257-2951(-)